jgi:hypothetical protein
MFNRTRKQTGQFIETNTAFFLRYYSTTATGERKKICVKLANKSGRFRTRVDVEHLIEKEPGPQPNWLPVKRLIKDFVERKYVLWVTDNKAAVTAYSYKRLEHIEEPATQAVAILAMVVGNWEFRVDLQYWLPTWGAAFDGGYVWGQTVILAALAAIVFGSVVTPAYRPLGCCIIR